MRSLKMLRSPDMASWLRPSANHQAVIMVALAVAHLALAASAATPAAAEAAAALHHSSSDMFLRCSFPDFSGAVKRFSKALTYPTLSNVNEKHHLVDVAAFEGLDAFLTTAYPKVWQTLKVDKPGDGGFSYLITWPGNNPELKPVLFVSHIDVVPVSPGTEEDWVHPPFSGAVAEGYIWGRGTLDVKVGVVGLLEAATALLDDGYQPERTLLFAFGQDEEVGGSAGAGQIAAKLAAEGQQLEFIWDEGGVIYAQGVPPITRLPVALVATAEKHPESVHVTLHSPGGHSSIPPTDGSSIAAQLGSFLSALTASLPRPRLVSPTREFVEGLLQLAPPWLSGALNILKLLPSSVLDHVVAHAMAATGPGAAALVRDTGAVTMLHSGTADNVLSQTAQLSVNFRLLPGTPVTDTIKHVQRWLGPNAAHANVTLHKTGFSSVPPSPVPTSPTDGHGFQVLKQAIQEVWKFSSAAGAQHEGKGVPVLPYLVPGVTDSRHYRNLTQTILRFCPYTVTADGIGLVHGTNEGIAVQDFQRLLCTYRAGLRLAGAATAGATGGASKEAPAANAGSADADEMADALATS